MIRWFHDFNLNVVQRTLSDTRDSNTYVVRKLADGNCWMTQNLKLVGSRTLTSANSDVTSNFTLTASDSSAWCTDSTATCINKPMVLNSGNATYGAYYNYYAATASTGTYSTTSGNASSSICSKGWKLPSSSNYATLVSYYGSAGAIQGSPGIVLSGYHGGSTTYDQGMYGYYWSSTAYAAEYAYFLSLSSSSGSVFGSGKNNGLAVRCVAK